MKRVWGQLNISIMNAWPHLEKNHRITLLKRKQSSSNHPFSGAFAVSFKEGNVVSGRFEKPKRGSEEPGGSLFKSKHGYMSM